MPPLSVHAHLGQERLHAVHDAEEVHFEDEAPVGVAFLGGRALWNHDASVVREDVNRSEGRCHVPRRGAQVIRIGDVRAKADGAYVELPELLGDRLGRLELDVQDGDVHPLLREGEGDPAADPVTAAHDDGVLFGEFLHASPRAADSVPR